jgi:soluble lytic murein transglycosylase
MGHAEAEALDAFREVLTREVHRARMDKRIGAKDFSGAKPSNASPRSM